MHILSLDIFMHRSNTGNKTCQQTASRTTTHTPTSSRLSITLIFALLRSSVLCLRSSRSLWRPLLVEASIRTVVEERRLYVEYDSPLIVLWLDNFLSHINWLRVRNQPFTLSNHVQYFPLSFFTFARNLVFSSYWLWNSFGHHLCKCHLWPSFRKSWLVVCYRWSWI